MAKQQSDKQWLLEWEEFIENIRAATPVDLNETVIQKRKRIAHLEANPEEWFKYYFPNFSYAKPAKFHKAATKRILENDEWYEVRAWSRELAKSTRTMMEVLYLTFIGKKKNVLLTSNSFENALQLLTPYKIILESNQRIINDYGIQEKPGSWESARFVTRKGVSFRAVGAGQNPRGARKNERRPDVLLIDDIDTDQDVRNAEMIKNRWDWIEQALIPTRSISVPTLIIFCGNIIAKYCCITEAIKKADHSDIINIRGDNGKSSWPEKNTEEMIDRVLSKISYASQQKEYFNNPILEGKVFKAMAYKPARPLNEYSILVCYTDPSFKSTVKNDYKAVVLVGKWKDEFHVIKAFVAQTTTAVMIDWYFEIMTLVGDCSCYYLMEEVFLQELIIEEVYRESERRDKTIPLAGDSRAKGDKYTRIETLLDPLNQNGKLYLNEHEQHNQHMMTLVEQFLAFGPGSRAHDDAPDAVEGAVWVINNKALILAENSMQAFAHAENNKRF